MSRPKRPPFCLFDSCTCIRKARSSACVGILSVPIKHDDVLNTYRLCLNGVSFSAEYKDAIELKTENTNGILETATFNDNDIDWAYWLFGGLQRAKKR